jgi:hypothetical protein
MPVRRTWRTDACLCYENEVTEEDREQSSDEDVDPSSDEGAADADPATDDEGDAPADDAPAAEAPAAEAPDAAAAPPTKRRRLSWWWLLPAAMVVEFYVYGHNGYIDVCVGKEGETDFSLVGQARTDDNRWKFPRCEQRTNLGLRSTYDDKVADAVKIGCRQATLFRHQGESKACEAAQEGWVHRVDTSFCPPWDPNYYQHLFWFLQ